MTEDPIERLAREGRELAAGDHSRHAQMQDVEALEREREREMKIGASVSRFARYGWLLVGIALGVALAIACAVAIEKVSPGSTEGEGSPAIGLAVLAGFLPTVILFFLRRGHARRAIARERRWATALPFRFSGYPDALGGRTEGRASMSIQFAGTAPDDDMLAAVFRTAGAHYRAGSHDKRVEYAMDGGDTSYSTNTHLADFAHRAVDVLLTLHTKYPVSTVHLSEFE